MIFPELEAQRKVQREQRDHAFLICTEKGRGESRERGSSVGPEAGCRLGQQGGGAAVESDVGDHFSC